MDATLGNASAKVGAVMDDEESRIFGMEIWLKGVVAAYVPYADHRQQALAAIDELARLARARRPFSSSS